MIRCTCPVCVRLDRREKWGEVWQGLLPFPAVVIAFLAPASARTDALPERPGVNQLDRG